MHTENLSIHFFFKIIFVVYKGINIVLKELIKLVTLVIKQRSIFSQLSVKYN